MTSLYCINGSEQFVLMGVNNLYTHRKTNFLFYLLIHVFQYTVFFFSFVLRNKADVSLFWEIWGHQRLPSDHKIGRKLPFRKKHHLMSFAIIQEEFQDELI